MLITVVYVRRSTVMCGEDVDMYSNMCLQLVDESSKILGSRNCHNTGWDEVKIYQH